MFLPGTYGTSLLRNHTLNGVLKEMANQGYPSVAVEGLKDAIDCNLYFFETQVSLSTMYLVLGLTVLALIGAYVLINVLDKRKG